MERKKWIDGARALAMIFVILGHAAPTLNWAILFTSPIKIPLFFILSGYLFNSHKGDFVSFSKNKLKKLIIPYFVLSIVTGILNFMLWTFTGSNPVKIIKMLITNLVMGETLWFVPCLILCEFFMFFIIKFTRNNVNYATVLSFIFMAVTLIFVKDGTKLAWGIDKVPVMTFVMFAGYFFRQKEEAFSKLINTTSVIVSGLIYVALILIGAKFTGMKLMDIHNSEYLGIFTIPQILFGCGFVILLLHKIKIPTFLTYIGQNTLTYYAFHTFSMVVLSKVAEALLPENLTSSGTGMVGIVITVVTLFIMVVPSTIINRYLPWMVGKKA